MIDLTKLVREFPDFDLATLPALPEGFVDHSWHNDVCPCFRYEKLRLTLWIDYADPAKRELKATCRFGLILEDWPISNSDADRAYIAETDDWPAVLVAMANTALDYDIDRTEPLFGKASFDDVYLMAIGIASRLGLEVLIDGENVTFKG